MLLTTFSSVTPFLSFWLSSQTAITDQLSQAQLVVLRHRWEFSNWWEQQSLGLKPREELMRRDILMRSSQSARAEVCWFARTMIPQQTYQSRPALFDQLYQNPLSSIIYHNPLVERYLLRSYCVSAAVLEYHWVAAWHENLPQLGVRFSGFRVNAQFSFYLLEIFLPGLSRVYPNSLLFNAI